MAWARSSFGDLNSVSIPKRNTQYYSNSNNQVSTVWNRNQQSTSTGKTHPYGVNPRGDNNASYPWQGPTQQQKNNNTSYPRQGPIQQQKNNNASYPQQGPTQEQKNNNTAYPRHERTQQQKNNTWQAPDKNSVSKLETLMAGYTANVIGVVIAKDSPRSIFSKKNAGSERFLVNFTLRDSVTAFVNVTCWGSENYIKDLCAGFCIGDIVKLGNVQVQSKTSDGSEEKFRAATPVGFHLTLSENHSSLALYDGLDLGAYAVLQHLPTKPNCDYYTLEDVLVNGQGLNAEHINLLAVVRKIGPARDIVTKTGKKTSRCEIVLMDESCPSFPFVLWGGELVDFSQTWAPLTTVLFIADVRVNYDDFRSGMLATADSKTIITVNPDTMDAKCLFQFAQTQTSLLAADETGSSEQADPPVDQIQDVLVVEQIANSDGLISYGQLYGVITKCDLDADNVDQFYWRRCSKCKQTVGASSGYQCINQSCTQGALGVFNKSGEVTLDEPDTEFSLPVDISDHTGTVHSRLSEQALESLLGIQVCTLMAMSPASRTPYKWKILMERFKFYIKMGKTFKQADRRLSVRVLACCKADPAEMERNLPH